MVSEELIAIIDADISKCEEQIKHGDEERAYNLYCSLISKYAPIIDGYAKNLVSMMNDYNGEYCKRNLDIMKQKLELFKAMGYENKHSATGSVVTIHNANQLNSTISISFSETRKEIEQMSSLPDSEIEEILGKINELEKISKSAERRTKKWERAKGIVKWLADKGVDVGIALLPLVFQMFQG